MSDFGYDREDLVSGVGEQLDKLESALNRAASERDPNTDVAYLVEIARARIGPAMDAARAALDEAVLEQRAIAAERLGIEQRSVALARAALCRALDAMEGATVFVTTRERRKHPEGTDLWLEDIEATRAAIEILSRAPASSRPEEGAVEGCSDMDRLRNDNDNLRRILERAQNVLGNMALENEGAFFRRWPISHEPLRADAKNLLPTIAEALEDRP